MEYSKFLDPKEISAFTKVSPLIKINRSVNKEDNQQASKLLDNFFPPLSQIIVEELTTAIILPIEDPELTFRRGQKKGL